MGQTPSNSRVGYPTVQEWQNTKSCTIISTLPASKQECLITGTVLATAEVALINELLKSSKDNPVLVYGENCADTSPDEKKKQLANLGFSKVSVYAGGLFEWLLLQDVYGAQSFSTTNEELDMLKYGPKTTLSTSIVSLSSPFSR